MFIFPMYGNLWPTLYIDILITFVSHSMNKQNSSSFPFGFPYSGSPQRVFFLYHPSVNHILLHNTHTPYPPTPHPTTSSTAFPFSFFPAPPSPVSFSLHTRASLLFTCPYHHSLAPLIFSPDLAILAVRRIYSFLI